MSGHKIHHPLQVTVPLYQYALDHALREPDFATRLREETEQVFAEDAGMQGAPDEAQLLGLLLKLMNAKKVIEVGIFTGYTTLIMALALPEDGKVIALDVSEQYASLGKKYWKEAGVDGKIELRIGAATESMQAIVDDGTEVDTFDLIFIDADKLNYSNYYELAIKLIKKGGLIVVDNVLWHGKVVETSVNDEHTNAIRALNDRVRNDQRVDICMLPFADGVTLARKK